MKLGQWIKEQDGELNIQEPEVVEKTLEDKLGDLQEYFENYSGAIAEVIIELGDDEPFKDMIDEIVELHEKIKNDLWERINKE